MTIIKTYNAFIINDNFGDSVIFNILGHGYLIEDLNCLVNPESNTDVS